MDQPQMSNPTANLNASYGIQTVTVPVMQPAANGSAPAPSNGISAGK
jgi:hypothetical protein